MVEKQNEHVVDSLIIELHWLCAQDVHGKDLPAWLHHMLAHNRQQIGKPCLSVVVLPACEREDGLVVMTLRDFLLWSHRRVVFNVSVVKSRPDAYSSKEE